MDKEYIPDYERCIGFAIGDDLTFCDVQDSSSTRACKVAYFGNLMLPNAPWSGGFSVVLRNEGRRHPYSCLVGTCLLQRKRPADPRACVRSR
jgi:hypothetical protein